MAITQGKYLSLSGLSYLVEKLRAEYNAKVASAKTVVSEGTGIDVTKKTATDGDNHDTYTVGLNTIYDNYVKNSYSDAAAVASADTNYELIFTPNVGDQKTIYIQPVDIVQGSCGVITSPMAGDIIQTIAPNPDANSVPVTVTNYAKNETQNFKLLAATTSKAGVMTAQHVTDLNSAYKNVDDTEGVNNWTAEFTTVDGTKKSIEIPAVTATGPNAGLMLSADKAQVDKLGKTFAIQANGVEAAKYDGLSANKIANFTLSKSGNSIQLSINNKTTSVDVSEFIKDGFLADAKVVTNPRTEAGETKQGTYLVLTFNTDAVEAGAKTIYIPVTDFFDGKADSVKLNTGYAAEKSYSSAAITAGATVQKAIAELHAGVDDAIEKAGQAAAAGVLSIGGITGTVTLTDNAEAGGVTFVKSGTKNGSISATVNLTDRVAKAEFINEDDIDALFPKVTA